MSTSTVLVTGVSGFLGTAVTLELIKKEYKVKGTVRTQRQVDAFINKYPSAAKHLEWTIVEDVSASGAFDSAVEGVDYIIHPASPFHYAIKDNERDMLRPAVEGTKSLLSAAAKNARIKHIVITSSFAAIINIPKGSYESHTYTDEDWNPATWEESITSEVGPFVYCASKKFGEKAAWDFMEKEKPDFFLTTINPPLILGPPSQPLESMDKLNQSSGEVWALISGKLKEIPPTPFPVWTDVRDIAELHVAALTNPKARNQRYMAIAGHFSFGQVAYTVAKAFPTEAGRIPPSDNDPPPPHYKTDSSKVERDFGIKWISFEQSIVDTAKELYGREKELAVK